MKQSMQQIARLWSELQFSQRVTFAGAAVAVCMGMIALIVWANRVDMQLLYGRLGEKDAAEIVTFLESEGFEYEIRGAGGSIYVPSSSVHKIRMTLAGKGIPAGSGVGFEIFDRSNFGISDFIQRTNYLRALQGELSRTVAQLDGVRSARVMVVMPENRLLLKTPESRPTASVFVELRGLSLNAEAVSSIRSLVSSSVEGLRPNDVVVIDNRGNVLSDDLQDDAMLGSASSIIRFRKATEEYFAEKIETMLATVLGPGKSVVRVSAEIDTEIKAMTEETFDPESQVARRETTTEDTRNTSEGAAKVPPVVGVSANVPDPDVDTFTSSPGKTSEENTISRTQEYEISRSTVSTTRNPGSISRLTAAVFIAARTTETNGEQTPNPRSAEEIASLREMVMNALGVQTKNGESIEQIVSIQEVEFAPSEIEFPSDTIAQLGNWLRLAQPFGALLLAVVIFLVFLRMMKGADSDQIVVEVLNRDATALPDAGAVKPASVSPEMLTDMIRQRPENVGATLRGWLNTKEGN